MGLCLDLRTSSVWERQSLLQSPGFHNLHSLILFIDNFKYASDFLRSLQVIDSKNIGISFTAARPSTSSSTTLSQFFTILGETCDHNNLLSFSLHNLTQLLVERSWDISMADEELCQLVRGWPKIPRANQFTSALPRPDFAHSRHRYHRAGWYRFQIPWWRNL